jgi:DNA sulfur modification protein DndD
MKLKLLKVKDFRQFRGEQTLEISTPRSSSRGVLTLVHGEMGHGKTTLLNAFRWCLHGRSGISDRFSGPAEIINSHVLEFDDNARSEVHLHFEHGGDSIELKRSLTKVQQLSTRKDDYDGHLVLTVTSVLTGGTHIHEGDAAQEYVNSIIPQAICELLFFDGEGINKLATKDENPKMGESVRTLLGLKVVESAIKCLGGSVLISLRKDDRDSSTGDDRDLKELRDSKDADLRKINEKKAVDERERSALLLEIQAYAADLKRKAGAKALQVAREGAEARVAEAQKVFVHNEEKLRKLISEKGYVLFCAKLVNDGLEITSQLRSERKIPAPIMTDFIKELIVAQKCICGGSLKPGSQEHDSVSRLLDVAKDAKFHDAAASLERTIGSIRNALMGTRKEFSDLIDVCVAKRAEIVQAKMAIGKVAEQLDALGDPDIDAIERNKAQAEEKRIRLERVLAAADRDAFILSDEIAELERKIKEAMKRSAGNSYAAERVALVEEALVELKETLRKDTDSILPELEKMVNESFSRMVEIPGRVRLTSSPSKKEDEIHIHVSLETQIAEGLWREDNANTGKRQCLSLAFISSLVGYAQKRSESTAGYMKEVSGDSYPMVMDAPFANLDPAAKKRFAPQLGGLATQVIAMLNSNHYDEEFEKGLETAPGIVGQRYVLVHHYRKLPDHGLRSIRIAGKDHPIMQLDDGLGYEWSEIRKIS